MKWLLNSPAGIALVVVLTFIALRASGITSVADKNQRGRDVKVARVLDGDTFDTADGERIRLLGIDAPEVAHHDSEAEHFGNESRAWLTEKLGDQTVKLTFDQRRKDVYGRTLAWVWIKQNLVNEDSLRTGNARLLSDFGLPRELEPRLRKATADARVAKRGLWKRK